MSIDLLFAKDLKLNYSGDIVLVTQVESKRQSIVLRLKTRKGSNMFHPDYGNDLYSMISDNITELWLKKAMSYVKECIEQDDTVIVKSIDSSFENEKRTVNFYIKYYLSEYGIEDSLDWGEEIG
ncbi:DUF2634 domain-containing protein [Clostridium chromiireducens]|uniref:DUF2634 domain-containing protein n=1 Tax=Clostridium chromiireducens TaxID=225345 RepID=A0A399IS01_9CLOT|nr:GPW/gp25 family protein [Clostridium chromiireducens]RII34302.1 DUF2634 domain-containing protein [Clostridium chromiireducens]